MAGIYAGDEVKMLTLQAPAKINLTLEVLGKREDGFHEIRSVIQTINLCDSLNFRLGQGIEIRSNVPAWIAEKSLVARAVKLVKETTGCSKGVMIEVGKRIPLLAGLGGDSSDAVAALRGLNKLWELGLSPEELLGLASQLGSDATFFLYGGTALVAGRGEKVTLLPPLPHRWVVLMVPPIARTPGKTERLYASLNPGHHSGGQITDSLVATLRGGHEVTPSSLFNVFDDVAAESFSGLDEYRQQFLESGATSVHLAGSGPALFTLVEDKVQAERIYRKLQQSGQESYLAETLSAIEQPN